MEEENADLTKKNDEIESNFLTASLEAEELKARLMDLQQLGDNFDQRVAEELAKER